MKKLYLLISFVAIVTGAYAQCSVTATSLSDVVCNGQCNGVAYAAQGGGGTPPYTYLWTPGNQTAATATGLCAGVYTCLLHDAVGCSSTDTVQITQPTPLLAHPFALTASTCTNGMDGCVRSAPSGGNGGPFGYVWSPAGGNSQTACGLEGGNSYTVTVTDHKGCTAVDSVLVSQPANPLHAASIQENNVSCNNGCNGSAVINLTGGTTPYYYNSNPIGTPFTLSNLCSGPWQATFTDVNGCTFQAVGSLSEPTALSVNASTSSTIGCAGGNGCALATANGGTPNYTYLWAPTGGNGATACGLSAGTYTVNITDANGCSGTDTVAITQPSTFSATGQTTQNELCFGGNIGSAHVTPTGGTLPYTYAWSPTGGTGATANNLTAGSYNVIITDANGCTATAGAIITQPAQINPHLQLVNNVSCNGGFDGCVSVAPTGGTGTYTYDWSTTFPQCGLPAGTYTVTVSDANGCTMTSTTTVTQPTPLTLTMSSINASCSSCPNGSAIANPSGGSPIYTYFWSTTPTQTTRTATGLVSGNYTCCVTDVHGCQTCAGVHVDFNVSAADVSADNISFNVYPNPFHSSATLIINSNTVVDAELVIYDLIGNEIRKAEIKNRKSEINNLSAGVYLLVVRDEANGRMAHSRLVVQ